ncbi:histidinol-phosphatase HisJ family protein [Halobacillus sp. B23F22_1]|uniref:histidinol-phosphatase HisJ family protein n=1 Tax=Halobacillus sp. B23F22_1 TaxID=3459514 RepID=UPI00373F4935
MYLTEYHHHTDNSIDSKANMEEVCKQAIVKGIDEICFTDHYSVNPKLPTYGHMDFDIYFSQIKYCQDKFKDDLTVKAGIELCEPHLMQEEYHEVLSQLEIDFILGSVHNINEEKLRKFMNEREKNEAYQKYFEEVYSLVSSADIDVLAHLDLMKRYAVQTKGNYAFTDFQEILHAILEKAVERDIGIEINTSGLSNEHVGEAFPTREILKLYKHLGGEILTIGSDSHHAHTVGNHLEGALQMARQAEFTHVYTFTKRKLNRLLAVPGT